ncbi:hypothetical protein BH10ACI3_BH10ACI3_22390 [soil metagenome]
MQDHSMLVALFTIALLGFGFIAIVVVEVILLKRKGWVEKGQAVTYPIVVAIVNIPAAAVSYIVGGVLVMGLVFYAIPMISDGLGMGPDVGSGQVGLVVYLLLSVVVLYFIFLFAFLLVRAVISVVMVRTSSLTWKYWFAQAAVLAVLFAVVQAIGITFTLLGANASVVN